ncbi:Aste57867_16617 [Aphanomyces stellatus]|uniref:Aste57867_16617 protein n=1 Tax=Aphanomyces stellatus TaxID=120398 RepID=A0A485L7G2_9STRA|nr:hypothetical protein As57867_016560 [Aphanomyces stellatus]VFT93388.1 Aste57867_16617 [Aphanomyces stellatus]
MDLRREATSRDGVPPWKLHSHAPPQHFPRVAAPSAPVPSAPDAPNPIDSVAPFAPTPRLLHDTSASAPLALASLATIAPDALPSSPSIGSVSNALSTSNVFAPAALVQFVSAPDAPPVLTLSSSNSCPFAITVLGFYRASSAPPFPLRAGRFDAAIPCLKDACRTQGVEHSSESHGLIQIALRFHSRHHRLLPAFPSWKLHCRMSALLLHLSIDPTYPTDIWRLDKNCPFPLAVLAVCGPPPLYVKPNFSGKSRLEFTQYLCTLPLYPAERLVGLGAIVPMQHLIDRGLLNIESGACATPANLLNADYRDPVHLTFQLSPVVVDSRMPHPPFHICPNAFVTWAFLPIHDQSCTPPDRHPTMKDHWIIDSGATASTTPTRTFFSKYVPCKQSLRVADGKMLAVIGYGELCLRFNLSEPDPPAQVRKGNVLFTFGLHCPDLKFNLLSVHHALADGFQVTFPTRHACVLSRLRAAC